MKFVFKHCFIIIVISSSSSNNSSSSSSRCWQKEQGWDLRRKGIRILTHWMGGVGGRGGGRENSPQHTRQGGGGLPR